MDNLADRAKYASDEYGEFPFQSETFDRLLHGDVTGKFGYGETSSESYVRARARIAFLFVLYRVSPETTHSLLRPELVKRSRHEFTKKVSLYDDFSRRIAAVRDYSLCETESEREHLDWWQARWNLRADWLREAARETFKSAVLSFRVGIPGRNYPLFPPRTDRDARPITGKVPMTEFYPNVEFPLPPKLLHPVRMINIPVFLDDLKYPDIDGADSFGSYIGILEDDGLFGMFNPREETIDEAAKRMLPALEKRLRFALELLTRKDKELPGATDPLTFRSTKPFERLVRYQVLGESRNAIARADGVSHTTVSEQIKQTATLIELTLRQEKGGRPRKPA